ncbi:MAG: hypothetical protein U9O94_06880 [Nanoarchaeota archaeon]|nr:hypothetical protein [Nanoarchaeota archaeon]
MPVEPEKPKYTYIKIVQELGSGDQPLKVFSQLPELNATLQGKDAEDVYRRYLDLAEPNYEGKPGIIHLREEPNKIVIEYNLDIKGYVPEPGDPETAPLLREFPRDDKELNELTVFTHLYGIIKKLDAKGISLKFYHNDREIDDFDRLHLGKFGSKASVQSGFEDIVEKNYTGGRFKDAKMSYGSLIRALNECLEIDGTIEGYAQMQEKKMAELFTEESIMATYSKTWHSLIGKLSEESNEVYSTGLERFVSNIPEWVSFEGETLAKYSERLKSRFSHLSETELLEYLDRESTRKMQNILSNCIETLGVFAGENVAINIQRYKNDLDFIFGLSNIIDHVKEPTDQIYEGGDIKKGLIVILKQSVWLLNEQREYTLNEFGRELLNNDKESRDNRLRKYNDLIKALYDRITRNQEVILSPGEIKQIDLKHG